MSQAAEHTAMVRGLEKRKACDLCHIKKIRCDTRKPTCSHCVVYGAQCTYTPHIKRRRKEVHVRVQADVGDAFGSGAGPTQTESRSGGRSTSAVPAKLFSTEALTSDLPPLADILPVIQDYFVNLNSLVPLFDQSTFMRMLDESGSARRPSPHPALNAAVNVILALTYLQRATTRPPIPSFDPSTCISSAHSAITSLEARQHDLLSLQVHLGLAMLYLGTPHPGLLSASALVGSAVKLAHSLRLHHSRTNALFGAGTALQRARVFWIAYILDRDLSFRRGDPLLQQESDHDIAEDPVSSSSAPGSGGLVRFSFSSSFAPGSGSGSGAAAAAAAAAEIIHLNVFQAQLQLARIQGDIYEQLCSVRAEAQPADARQRSRAAIHAMLRGWRAAIPAELRPDRLLLLADADADADNTYAFLSLSLSPKPAARQLVALHFAWLSCFLKMHRVGSHDAEWLSRLVHYSQRIVEPAAAAAAADEPFSLSSGGSATTTLLSPFLEPSSAWAEVVGVARECARLARLLERGDSWLIWNIACTYMAATLVLIANALTVAEHERSSDADADADARLIEDALAFFSSSSGVISDPVFAKLHTACAELSCRARIARARFSLAAAAAAAGGGPKSASVAWLENEARRSAGHSALALVEAFTMAEVKPVTTRMWRAGASSVG